MKTNPRTKKLIPLVFGAVEVVGAKSVRPIAKKKNQRGAETRSPSTQAGWRM
jgi:hypothetical protein